MESAIGSVSVGGGGGGMPGNDGGMLAMPSAPRGEEGPLAAFARPLGGYQVTPPYPESARRLGVQGITHLRFEVLANGRVGSVAGRPLGRPSRPRSGRGRGHSPVALRARPPRLGARHRVGDLARAIRAEVTLPWHRASEPLLHGSGPGGARSRGAAARFGGDRAEPLGRPGLSADAPGSGGASAKGLSRRPPIWPVGPSRNTRIMSLPTTSWPRRPSDRSAGRRRRPPWRRGAPLPQVVRGAERAWGRVEQARAEGPRRSGPTSQALALRPDGPDAQDVRLRLAFLRLQAGDKDGALPLLTALARPARRCPRSGPRWAASITSEEQLAESERAFRRAAELRDDGKTWFNLAVVRLRLFDKAGARSRRSSERRRTPRCATRPWRSWQSLV